MQKAIWHCVCEIRSPSLKDFVKWHHALLQSLQHHLAIMVPTQMSPCTAEAQTIPGVDGKLDAYSLNRLVWGQQLILWQKDMRWIFVNFMNESLFLFHILTGETGTGFLEWSGGWSAQPGEPQQCLHLVFFKCALNPLNPNPVMFLSIQFLDVAGIIFNKTSAFKH